MTNIVSVSDYFPAPFLLLVLNCTQDLWLEMLSFDNKEHSGGRYPSTPRDHSRLLLGRHSKMGSEEVKESPVIETKHCISKNSSSQL